MILFALDGIATDKYDDELLCVCNVYTYILLLLYRTYMTRRARARFAAHEFLELEGGSVGT